MKFDGRFMARSLNNFFSFIVSPKETFERHRVVFTVGTSIASVATAWAGESCYA